jgi:DNA invertase Pin-like site-specific DNA recombinase
MTIQLPALAARASFIATIAAVLIAAMVITGRADAASGPVTPLLAQGAGMGTKPSAQVRQVQRALQRRGYDLGAPGVDGRFGPLTAAAVRRVQAARGLAADGLVGQRTRAALRLPRRVASATQRGSHAQRAVTSARRPTPTNAASDASRPSTITTVSPDHNRSTDVVATVVLCVVLAALAALALVGLGRRVSRARSPSRLRTETLPAAEDAAWVSANGAGSGFPPSPVPDRDEVIGYVTTSTDAWSEADEGSAVAIEATCEGSDWSLFEIVCDRENGRTLDRPGLSYALERIAEGQARGLVVSDLQRLSRSPDDLGVLMAWFRDANARLVALDLDLDTSTPAGRRVASTLIALGDGERGSAQTARAGGAEARIRGRPAIKDRPELMERISIMRSANLSLQQIADQFNAEGVPTLRGGKQWRPSSIQAALGYRRPGPRDRLPPLGNRGG